MKWKKSRKKRTGAIPFEPNIILGNEQFMLIQDKEKQFGLIDQTRTIRVRGATTEELIKNFYKKQETGNGSKIQIEKEK